MNNYIRACFCVERKLGLSELGLLNQELEKQSCSSFSSPKMNQDLWVEQEFEWKIEDHKYSSRLLQFESQGTTNVMISFDVEESIFLGSDSVTYYPNRSPIFCEYSLILVSIINKLNPLIGIVDWEADLLCSSLSKNSLSCWGDYLSNRFLKYWNKVERDAIQYLVDEMVFVNDYGILVFNHPLGYSENLARQNQFWNLLDQNKKYLILNE